jgi:hypothetical protein
LEKVGLSPEKSDRNFFVVKAIRKLGLHKLRLGAISTRDPAIAEAIRIKAFDNRDAQPLEAIFNQAGLPPTVKGLETDRSDAIFWRTLLEIFCRAYAPPRGRPAWSLSDSIHLVFDLDEILRKELRGRWDKTQVLRTLTSSEPYKQRYPDGVSYEKNMSAKIDAIEEWVGPFDSGMLERLSYNNPDAFWEIFEQRNPKAARTDDEIKELVLTLRKPLLTPVSA